MGHSDFGMSEVQWWVLDSAVPHAHWRWSGGRYPAMTKWRWRVAMEKRLRCTSCNRQFEAVGQGTMREVPEGVTRPSCRTPNEVMWPMDGAVFARAIPEYLEVSRGSNPIFEH
jgi:hypothetical protein